MKFYPAIDLMDGKVVRLKKGKRKNLRVYGDPLEIARSYDRFVDRVHIVDLDGAFEGKSKNLEVVEEIANSTNLEVQFGGGLRSYGDLKRVDRLGVSYPIIGTKAFDLDFLNRACKEFSGITVSLDVKGGNLALEGWQERSSLTVTQAYEKLQGLVERFIYTEIDKDGTLEGIGDVEKFWAEEEFIYAGGVTSLEDLARLKESPFSGVIVGKALYEGTLDLKEALRLIEN